MASRANWKGYLKLSLVSCPVVLFPASTASEKVSFHLLSGETGHRLKQHYVDSETGDVVEREERVKGFELGNGDYVTVTDDELAAVQIESSHTIDIERFVPKAEIDPVYIDSHYYLAPDDKVGQEAFAVIREAMRKRGMVGIARVVLFGRERMVMIEPRSKGLMATTLHYAYEIRGDDAYFDEIPEVQIAKDLLDLASHIIDTKRGPFDPSAFEDRYQDAVRALIEAKTSGKPVETPKPAKPGNVVDLMQALRESLKQPGGLGQSKRPKNAERPVKKPPSVAKSGSKSTSKSRSTTKAAATKPARRKAS